MASELVVSNVRVLAMGQTVETKNGEAVVTGATATLELDPRQAEIVLLAQRSGSLALELRPLVDAHPTDGTGAVAESPRRRLHDHRALRRDDQPAGQMTQRERGIS